MNNEKYPTAIPIASAPPCYNIIIDPLYQYVIDEECNNEEEEELLDNNLKKVNKLIKENNKNTPSCYKKQNECNMNEGPSPLDDVNYETTNYELPKNPEIGKPYIFNEKMKFPEYKSIYDK